MTKQYAVNDVDVLETIENALDAVDADDELPDVSRGRGPPRVDEVSTGEALAIVAEAYTGWSA